MSNSSESVETDSELLMQFVRHGDDNSFRQLIERHGAVVMGVCRQVSRNEQDAEDAFQATLLILARRASDLLRVASLGSWLHRVAYRTALRGLEKRARRRETRLLKQPSIEQKEALEQIHLREVQQLLHEELQQLPRRYRDVVVLCDLKGETRAQAADDLDSTESAVKAALARGRRQLRLRLLRRGVAMSTALVVAQDSFAAVDVSSALITSTVDLCRGEVCDGSQVTSETLGSLAREGDTVMLLSTSRSIAIGTIALICAVPLFLFAQISIDSSRSSSAVVVDPAEETAELNDSKSASGPASPKLSAGSVGLESQNSSGAAGPQQAAQGGKSTSLDAGTFVLVTIRDRNVFLSYNKGEGSWQKHEFRRGLTAVPVISGGLNSSPGIAGFQLEGSAITELAAVDSQGRFRIHKMPQPLNKPFRPVVHTQMLYGVVDGKVHAFSARTGTWDSLEAPQLRDFPGTGLEGHRRQGGYGGFAQGGNGRPNAMTVSDGALIVEFEDRIAAFSVESGSWSTSRFDAATQ